MGDDYLQVQTDKARAWLLNNTATLFDLVLDYRRTRPICESPLEEAFSIWFFASAPCDSEVGLLAQREVVANENRYRLDFVLTVQPKRHEEPIQTKVAVELDGHAFHEKTLEQVTYRNQRDRDLQMAGWRVLHYSFSEFTSAPQKCCEAAWDAALTWYEEQEAGKVQVAV